MHRRCSIISYDGLLELAILPLKTVDLFCQMIIFQMLLITCELFIVHLYDSLSWSCHYFYSSVHHGGDPSGRALCVV